MSPTVNNFVHDLVAMAKAMEDLPMVQEQLDNALRSIELFQQTVQDREEKIINLKSQIETHLGTIRSLEVERDDALFQTLEANDRTDKALAFVKGVFGNAGALIQALEPPRVEELKAEVPAPVPANGQGQSALPVAGDPNEDTSAHGGANAEGQSAVDPTQDATIPTASASAPQEETSASGSQGQSEPLPPQADARLTGEGSAGGQSLGETPPAPTQADASPKPGPYAGKRYINVPGWISRQDWLNGGGTEEDYDYRPEHNLHTA